MGGLTTPREPSEILSKKVISKSGKNVTINFKRGAEEALMLAQKFNVKKALLKSKSPSCGCGQIYDGTFSGNLIKGDGITTELLKKHGIEVITEKDLNNL